MKKGDKVVMRKDAWPKTRFRTGVVTHVGGWNISVKRDGYKGHEFTWWSKSDWRVSKNQI